VDLGNVRTYKSTMVIVMNDPNNLKHSEHIVSLLNGIEKQRHTILQLGMKALGQGGSDLYLCDRLAIGAIKRYLSTLTAYKGMIESWNRSEERRVGKECRSRWSALYQKKKRRYK